MMVLNPAVQVKQIKSAKQVLLGTCIDLFMEKHVSSLLPTSQGSQIPPAKPES